MPVESPSLRCQSCNEEYKPDIDPNGGRCSHCVETDLPDWIPRCINCDDYGCALCLGLPSDFGRDLQDD
jgi:hypothetical protein